LKKKVALLDIVVLPTTFVLAKPFLKKRFCTPKNFQTDKENKRQKALLKKKTSKMNELIFDVFSCREGAQRRSTLYCNLLPANFIHINCLKVFEGAWGTFSKKSPT
jgi:hypothetical protein